MAKTVKAVEKILVKNSFMMPSDGTTDRIFKVGEEVKEALLKHPFFKGKDKHGRVKLDYFFERKLNKDSESEAEPEEEKKKTKSTKKDKGK